MNNMAYLDIVLIEPHAKTQRIWQLFVAFAVSFFLSNVWSIYGVLLIYLTFDINDME